MPKYEPEPEVYDVIPPAPAHLDDLAKKIFSDTAEILKSYDLLTHADLHPLELFADAYSQWVQAVEVRNDLQASGEDAAGAIKQCREYAADCNRWFRVLGLGPSYRVGLVANYGLGGKHQNADIGDPVTLAICNG